MMKIQFAEEYGPDSPPVKYGICPCGHKTCLTEQRGNDFQCVKCHRDYNCFGQELAPRDQWEDVVSEKPIFDKIRDWAKERKLIKGTTPEAQFEKLLEETTELYSGIRKGRSAEIVDAIGDCCVVLTILSEQYGLSIEQCIESAYEEIKDRKGKMVNGVFVKEKSNVQ